MFSTFKQQKIHQNANYSKKSKGDRYKISTDLESSESYNIFNEDWAYFKGMRLVHQLIENTGSFFLARLKLSSDQFSASFAGQGVLDKYPMVGLKY